MADEKERGCAAQEWVTQVHDIAIRHGRPICRKSGFFCIWVGDEDRCNLYEADEGGEQ